MATAPIQPAAPAEDPTAAVPEAEGGYTICIKVGADGQISVGVEDEAAEAQAGAESPEQESAEESSLQPVGSIKEALTAALDIYRSNGQAPEDSGAMQDEFTSGFKGQ